MMTENATLTKQQTNVEQEALFLNAPDSVPTTSDVILIGEDSATPTEKTATLNHDERVRADFASKKTEYAALLDFKVKNELVAQVFAKDTPSEGAINIEKVAKLLKTEMQAEQDRNFQGATYLENTAIPSAQLRDEPLYGKPGVYSQRDVDSLWVRSDSYREMADYIGNTQPIDEEAYFELAEEYIARLREEAQTEAITILKQRKHELEASRRAADEKIAELEKTIDTITHERDDARHEVLQRDMEMLDSEFETHMQQSVERLTEEARSIAK